MLLTVRDAEGKERSLTVIGEPKGPMAGASLLSVTPEPLPISMQPREGIYWFEYLPQDKVVYWRLNQIRNDEKEPLPQFCERLFKFINEHDVDKLVIDLSSDQGGDGEADHSAVQPDGWQYRQHGGGASSDARTWIAPQLYAPPSFVAYRAKRDPALEAILAYGRER